MKRPLKLAVALLACAGLVTGIGSPLHPASPFGASVASAQAPAPPSPTPAPTPDPNVSPFVVKLEGPSSVTTGGFAVVVTKPADAVIRWKNEFPAGSAPLELTDNAGRLVLCFFSPAPGTHRFGLSAQLPVAGLDPFAEASHVVVVGPVVPPAVPPVVVDPTKPVAPPPAVDPATTPTAAIYVYEKDETAVPSAVRSALNRLNRERKILATEFEDDTIDDTGSTPAQYTIPLAAARKAGLPALVVMAGSEVLSVTLAPTTEEQVLEAVK